MKRALPDVDTVKATIDTVLVQAAATGRRPTVTAVERHLGIPHATFHRHYSDMIDTHFRPRVPGARPTRVRREDKRSGRCKPGPAAAGEHDLRRTLPLYEEAIRQPTVENAALRQGATVVALPARSRPGPAVRS